MSEFLLTCNAGSNSLKCALCEIDGKTVCYTFEADRIHGETVAAIKGWEGKSIIDHEPIESGYDNALSFFYGWIEEALDGYKLVGAGHRVVHGGEDFDGPVLITPDIRKKLEKLIPLAPLHQPYNLKLIDLIEEKIGDIPQVACFDTAFHSGQPWKARQFALPSDLAKKEGLYRYGFHGLSYDYIAGMLNYYLEDGHTKRVIVAHLGSGASMCAMKNGKSIATTMGFSALDGLMMGKRCGDLDPGVILYLLKEKNMSAEDIEELLYKKSGLLGVSGISSDMRDLDDNENEAAQRAVELFCYMAARQMGGLMMALGGIDTLVFTGAMGVNDSIIREKICNYLSWLPLEIDNQANTNNKDFITTSESEIDVLVIPTNEEAVIAAKTAGILGFKEKRGY